MANGQWFTRGGHNQQNFGIDIETCLACGGAVRIIACIEDPEVNPHPPRWESRRSRSLKAAAMPGAAPDTAARLSGTTQR